MAFLRDNPRYFTDFEDTTFEVPQNNIVSTTAPDPYQNYLAQARNLFDTYATGFDPGEAGYKFWADKYASGLDSQTILDQFINPEDKAARRLTYLQADPDWKALQPDNQVNLPADNTTINLNPVGTFLPNIRQSVSVDDMTAGLDTLGTITGAVGNDTIAGALANDTITGGVTNDTITGATTTDTITGAVANDTITGAAANDINRSVITAGTDTITGGLDTVGSNILDTTAGAVTGATGPAAVVTGATGPAGALNTITAATQVTAATGPTGGLDTVTAAVTGATAPKEDLVYDYEGRGYDKVELLNLASQIAPNITQLAGGAFSTKGESIGFDYDVAKQILGGEPTAAQQVVLDMARNMLKMGIKDISQLNVKDIRQDLEVFEQYDENGRPTGRYYTQIQDPFDAERVITRELTPEEAAKIRTETTQTAEGYQIRRFAEDVLTGKGLYSGEQLITQTNQLIDKLSMDVGATYTGKDATKYALVINPTTGKPEFMTYVSSTSDMDKVNAALTLASFVPGINVFAKAAQAILAIRNGDVLGGLAALAGARGYADIATALNVAKAAQNGDALGIVRGLLDNPTIAGAAGGIKLEGNITLADVGNGLNLIAALENKNWAAALTYAGNLTNSQDLRTAGAATRVIAAVNSGNPMAVADAIMGLDKVIQAGNKVNDPNVATNIASRVQNTQVASVSSNITGTATDAIGDAPYTGATGATGPVGGLTVAAGDVNAEDTIDRSSELSGLNTLTKNLAEDTEFGFLDKAVADAQGRNVLAISNTEADTPEEAAALAKLKGYNSFSFGGNTYSFKATNQDIADQVNRANIEAAGSFDEAFKLARETLGPGKTFEWGGKSYTTTTETEKKQEDLLKQADLSFSKDRLPLAANSFLSNAASQPALYNPLGLSPTELVAQFDRFANATPAQRAEMMSGSGGQMFTLMADSITSKAGIDPKTGLSTAPKIETTKESDLADKAKYVLADAGAALTAAFVGLTNTFGWTERGGEADKAVKILNQVADDLMPDEVRKQKTIFENEIKDAKGAWETLKVIGKAPFSQPLYVATQIISEIVQETAAIAATGGVVTLAKFGQLGQKIALKLGIGTDVGINVAESAGAASQEAYERTQRELAADVKSGKITQEQANKIAQENAEKNLVLAGTITGVSMMLPGGNALTKQIFGGEGKDATQSIYKTVAKTTGKETLMEMGEEGGIEYGTQKVVNPNAATNYKSIAYQSGMGGLTSAGTVATISTIDASLNNINTSLMDSGASQQDVSAIKNDVSSALSGGVPVSEVRSNVVEYLTTDLGYSQDKASEVADSLINNQAILNFATTLDEAGLDNTQVSKIASGVNEVLSSDADINTQVQNTTKVLSDAGLDQATIQKINTTLFPGATTGTTATTAADTGTTATTAADTGTTATTAADTGTTATTAADTGTTATTAADTTTETKGDVTTTTATDANNNTTTQTEVNNNTGTTTETTTNNNTNTTTQTETNPNNNTTTTTETNNNNNTTTQTTVNNNNNTTTTSQTNSNNQVTSETTIDQNNNTESTTNYNPDTKTATTVVTDTNTGEVIDVVTRENVDPPVVDPVDPVETEDPTKTTKTSLPKLPTTTPAPQMMAMLGASGLTDYSLPVMGLSPDIKLFTTLEEGQTGVPLSEIAPVEQKQALTDEEIEAILEERRMEREREQREAMMRELGYYEDGSQDYVDPGYAEGGLVDHNPEFFSEGGASLANRYVKGDGDGTSDSVPAMLASGEFVIPADVVSSLGNGDNDAGASVLDHFLMTIREHKRNADPSELPEDSKGPLVYLEEALVKVRRKNGRTK